MKKKLLLMATTLLSFTLLTACSSGTYSKYVKLGEYKGLEITRIKSEITDEALAAEIEYRLEEATTYVEKDGAAKEGDLVNLDYTGTVDSKEFDAGSAEDIDLELGSGYFLEEVESQLVGAKAGDKKEITATLTEDYGEDLAGKKAVFAVTVNTVSDVKKAEYNDAFVKENYGVDTTEEYETNLRAELLAAQEEENRYTAGSDALQQVFESSTFNGYPEELYEKCKTEYDELNQQFAEMWGIDIADLELDEAEEKEEIISNVNNAMLTVAIAEKEKLKISDEEYQKYLESNFAAYGLESAAQLEENYGKESIMEQALLEKVQNFLLDNAKITEVTEEEYYGSLEDEDSEYVDFGDVEMEEDTNTDTDAAETTGESESESETAAASETESTTAE